MKVTGAVETRIPNGSPGSVLTLWRYPVKSMLGEELASGRFVERGLAGDRAYALIDRETGKIASAKNPRKWFRLVTFTAKTIAEPDDAWKSAASGDHISRRAGGLQRSAGYRRGALRRTGT